MPLQEGEATSSVRERTVTVDQVETGGVKGGQRKE